MGNYHPMSEWKSPFVAKASRHAFNSADGRSRKAYGGAWLQAIMTRPVLVGNGSDKVDGAALGTEPGGCSFTEIVEAATGLVRALTPVLPVSRLIPWNLVTRTASGTEVRRPN